MEESRILEEQSGPVDPSAWKGFEVSEEESEEKNNTRNVGNASSTSNQFQPDNLSPDLKELYAQLSYLKRRREKILGNSLNQTPRVSDKLGMLANREKHYT